MPVKSVMRLSALSSSYTAYSYVSTICEVTSSIQHVLGRNGGRGGGGLVHSKGENSIAMSAVWLGFENPSVGVGEPLLLSANRPRTPLSYPVQGQFIS